MLAKGVRSVKLAAEPGFIEFTASGTHDWVVPSNVYSIFVCMIGGGGGGRKWDADYGGHAGQVYSGDKSVTPGAVIPITVGAGGGADSAGGSSSFASETVNGGSGGNCTSPIPSDNCMGTFTACCNSEAGFSDAIGGNGTRGTGAGHRGHGDYYTGGAGVVHISWGGYPMPPEGA